MTRKLVQMTDSAKIRSRKECRKLKIDPTKRFKELAQEKARLKTLSVDVELNKGTLKDASRGKLLSLARCRVAVGERLAY